MKKNVDFQPAGSALLDFIYKSGSGCKDQERVEKAFQKIYKMGQKDMKERSIKIVLREELNLCGYNKALRNGLAKAIRKLE